MDVEVLASGSSGNCYKLKSSDTTLLIECGIPIKIIEKKLNYTLSKIDGCIITHEHKDHAKSFKELLRKGVEVYATKGTTTSVMGEERHHRINYIKINEVFNIGSLKIFPFKSIHDAKEPCNFFIKDTMTKENLVFITDTQLVPLRFKHLDYAMIEINYVKETINSRKDLNRDLRKRIKENHMSLETAVDFLKKCSQKRLKKIYVLHLSDKNSDEEIIKETLQKEFGVSVIIC